jgi:hypothetical protein
MSKPPMANQLTYDPTEAADEEFSAEELESLAVGEELAQEQERLLAGKYRDAEELERAYMELQKKLGSQDSEQVDEEPEQDTEQVDEEYELPAGAELIQQASAEYYENGGQLSEETLSRFSEMSSRDLVESYMALQANQPQQEAAQVADLSEREVNFIQNSVGGEQAYSSLVQWAAENLPPDYVQAFDSVVESGQVQAIQLAVAGLQREYENTVGYEGRVLSGKAAANSVDAFRSQAEVVRAMNDPRYEADPAYRQDVFDKLERSNIQY